VVLCEVHGAPLLSVCGPLVYRYRVTAIEFCTAAKSLGSRGGANPDSRMSEERPRLPARLRPRGTMRPLLGVPDGQVGAMRYGGFEISRSSASAACGLGR